MAHNLNIKNGRASMMYFGESPWHRLGQKLDRPATAEEAIKAAQMDYEVRPYPVFAEVNGVMVPVPDRFATVRTDTREALGVVSSGYRILQNAKAFEFFDGLVGSGEAMYHTAGVLGRGERVWILAKLPDYIRINGEDIVEKYLLLTHGHDGKTAIVGKVTPIRVVCENTLSQAMSLAGLSVKVSHTSGMEDNLRKAHQMLGLTNKLYADLGEIFKAMSLRKITSRELVDYVTNLVPDLDPKVGEDPDKYDNRNRNRFETRDKILELVEVGRGSAPGTLWGAYNGVTEFADHVGRQNADPGDIARASMFGAREDLKVRAFDLAKSILAGGSWGPEAVN
jgi:phage/plasmid-like protein (TIGR03299 family)